MGAEEPTGKSHLGGSWRACGPGAGAGRAPSTRRVGTSTPLLCGCGWGAGLPGCPGAPSPGVGGGAQGRKPHLVAQPGGCRPAHAPPSPRPHKWESTECVSSELLVASAARSDNGSLHQIAKDTHRTRLRFLLDAHLNGGFSLLLSSALCGVQRSLAPPLPNTI